MSNVIQIERYRNPGNGAREALMKTLTDHDLLGAKDIPCCTDIILASLWIHGFKVTPLDRDDT